MKHRIFRMILSVLVVFTMVFNSVSVTADSREKGTVTQLETYTNPRYADIADADKEEIPTLPEYETGVLANSSFTSLADARDYFVSEFAKRSTTIVFTIPNDVDIKEIMDVMEVHTGNPVGGDYLAWSYRRIGGYVESYGSRYTYHLTFTYYDNAAQEKALDAEIVKVMNSLNLGGLSEYQKIVKIYNYICRNIEYDYEHDSDYYPQYTAYAALVNKIAVCQGYATLFYRMCLMQSIDARIIVNEDHAWNIVRLGGKYYNMDSTWDAGTNYYDFFLRCNANFWDHDRYPEYNTASFNRKYPMSETDHPRGYEYTIDDDGVLTVKLPGMSFLNGSPWAGDRSIKKVVLRGITSVGDDWFSGCENLVSFESDGSLVTIKSGAFAGCTALKYVYLPDGLAEINNSTFSGCTSLENIIIPKTVTYLPTAIFYNCTQLKRVYIPDTVVIASIRSFTGSNPTIYGYEGSNAETIAGNCSLNFVPITHIPGDINGNGNLSKNEVLTILNVIKGEKALTAEETANGDFYGDDGVIDIRDYVMAYDFVGGMVS